MRFPIVLGIGGAIGLSWVWSYNLFTDGQKVVAGLLLAMSLIVMGVAGLILSKSN